jgi:phosphomevalonate kinase
MKACAPGKLVLSGAYSVLEGAPAIVTAVDRYVCCDSARSAELVTSEVREALPNSVAPWFDASALRAEGRKLGLGSSAAILVASLAAVDERQFESEQALRQAVWEPALAAHRCAQGGGSGVDVAASTWGGTLIAQRAGAHDLRVEAASVPTDLIVEVWTSPVAASTPALLAAVARLRDRAPELHRSLLDRLGTAAARAATAFRNAKSLDLIAELNTQRLGFEALGQAAGAHIVTPEVARLARLAPADAAVLPSGAGGGDIVLWCSTKPSPTAFRELAAELEHKLLPLQIHARGVHRCYPESTSSLGS